MPSIAMTLTAGGAGATAGNTAPHSAWAVGFDHAALVAAGRSRADGNDLRVEHPAVGITPITAWTGLNTSACKLAFHVAATLGPAGVDAAYTIVFGDLSAAAPTPGAATANIIGATITVAANPAVALPNPGFPVNRVDDPDVVENTYPDFPTTRRRRINQNPRVTRTLNYNNVSPEDFYEAIAFVDALRGAGMFTPPSWLDATGYGYVVIDARFTQSSATGYNAVVTVGEVHA